MTDTDDRLAIEHLKYRYLRAVDTHDWAALAGTVTDDVQAEYGTQIDGRPLHFTGRDALVQHLSSLMTPSVITEHRVNHPIIEIDGDEATGSWYLQDRVMVPEFDALIIGAAFYRDRYRRTADGWRISATGYDRTFEATGTLSGAGLTVTPGPAITFTAPAPE